MLTSNKVNTLQQTVRRRLKQKMSCDSNGGGGAMQRSLKVYYKIRTVFPEGRAISHRLLPRVGRSATPLTSLSTRIYLYFSIYHSLENFHLNS